jgi:hypothetical protein
MMRTMFVAVGVVAAVIVVFGVVASRRPAAYRVERAVEVAAPPERAYAAVDGVEAIAKILVLFGDPWDPRTGQVSIEERVAGERLRMRLDLVKPMKSTVVCELAFARAGEGTRVTWTMDGTHNLAGKAASMVMNTDRMLGADLEKSLARLKAAAEG